MIVNQANLHGLTVGYSTAFNKSLEETQANYQKVATVVPSSTGEPPIYHFMPMHNW